MGSGAWNTAFSQAMYSLSVMGIPQNDVDGSIDCTSLVNSVRTYAVLNKLYVDCLKSIHIH